MPENNKKTAPKLGIVYVLTHPAMPGLVKIGTTINLEARLNTLFSSSVPLPFVVHHAVEVEDAEGIERQLHKVFGDKRENPRREFFRIEPEIVVAAIGLTTGKVVGEKHKIGDGEDEGPLDDTGITDDDIKARDKRARRPNFRFDNLGIPIGAILTFSRDANVTAKVVDGKNTVEFRGKNTTVSDAATTLLGGATNVNGAHHWKYNDETLNAIRTRKEEAGYENEDDS